MKNFPKEILVAWEEPENGQPYMMVCDKVQDLAVMGETVKAGIYKLIRITEITTEIKVK